MGSKEMNLAPLGIFAMIIVVSFCYCYITRHDD